MHLVNEVLDHRFGDFNVSNHAVTQRADGFDIARCLPHHQLGVVANGLDLLNAVDGLNGDHRGFVEHDAAAAHINDRVRSAEVNCHILRHHLEQAGKEHGWCHPDCCCGG